MYLHRVVNVQLGIYIVVQDVFVGVQGTGQTFDRQGFEAREKGSNQAFGALERRRYPLVLKSLWKSAATEQVTSDASHTGDITVYWQ
jgi:hypothetical protein